MSNDAWFAPKRCGYGSGLPLTWQGWVLCVAYAAVVIAAGRFLLPVSLPGFVAIMTAATSAFLLICARKTEGGWRWRCGKRDAAPSDERRRQKRRGAL